MTKDLLAARTPHDNEQDLHRDRGGVSETLIFSFSGERIVLFQTEIYRKLKQEFIEISKPVIATRGTGFKQLASVFY